jgi:hypothetical protein
VYQSNENEGQGISTMQMRGGYQNNEMRGGYQNNENESEGIRIMSMMGRAEGIRTMSLRVTVSTELRIKVTKDTDQ